MQSLLSLLKVLIFYVFVLYSVLVRLLVCSIISCLNYFCSHLMENFYVFGKCKKCYQHNTSEFSKLEFIKELIYLCICQVYCYLYR